MAGWTGFQRDFDRSGIFYRSSIGTKSGIEPVTGAVVGGLMGFLLFNVYPAKCLWEIPVLWHWADLWQVLHI